MKDLIRKILVPRDSRLSIEGIRAQSWFKEVPKDSSQMTDAIATLIAQHRRISAAAPTVDKAKVATTDSKRRASAGSKNGGK